MTPDADLTLPSTRELELETRLREREAENEALHTELTTLRRYLVKQPSPSTSDSVTLPPALLSLLLPFLADPQTSAQPDSNLGGTHSVTVALAQRAKLLQEENDELYDLLKHSETGRLKEEVRGLRRALRKMEGALRESHTVINTLSTELDKCYETLSTRPTDAYAGRTSSASASSKPIPTGPRAQKRPRMSQASASPQAHPRPLHREAELSPGRRHGGHGSPRRMEVEERSPDRGNGERYRRDRERERGERRSRERDRERERDNDYGRRNGRERERERDRRGGGGGGGRGSHNGGSHHSNSRGLVERIG